MADPTVNDSSSTDSNKERTGKVFVVDPNPPGTEINPPEDMFIYVKFSAYPRSRTTYGGTLEGDAVLFESGVEDEVNFISTKISYKDGKINPNPQKTYATTDWTEIGGFKRSDTRSSGILEGFGIKNIDIKYNASLVPVVDVTFTDVRGSALFDVIESDDRKTPYSLFFKLPYPVFKLSVKGYFGQKVDYCLHMVNWTSNFDGSTGNFDITANFLGFQQAFLNDMVIGNIIGAINTPEGRKNLDDIYNGRIAEGIDSIPSEDGQDLRQLDDFLTRIAKIQIESEILKSDSNNFEVLKNLNGKLSILKTIRSFIGAPIQKQPVENGSENKTQTEYLDRQNKKNIFNTSTIKDDELTRNQNYYSIRDFIVFKSQNQNAFKSYINTLSGLINKYNEFLEGIADNKFNPTVSVSKQKQVELEKNIGLEDGLKEEYDDRILSSFPDRTDLDEGWENYIIFTQDENAKPKSRKLEDVINAFINGVNLIPIKLTSNYKGGSEEVNVGINLSGFTKQALTDKVYYKNGFSEDTNVLVADFRKQRATIQDGINKLEESIKFLREQVQIEINEKILANFEQQFKFKPTINKCFEILASNTQAMVETIWDISDAAERIGSIRKEELRNYETDIIDSATEIAWPSVYEIGTDNSLKEIYIGEAGVDINNFPELRFVEDVFKVIVAQRKNLEQITRSSILKNGLDSDNWYPINPIDYKINPWIRLNASNDINSIGEELLRNILLRLFVLKNYSNFNGNTGLEKLSDYANLEAIAMNKTVVSQNTRNIMLNENAGTLGGVLIDIKNQLDNPNGFVAEGKFDITKSNFWKNFIDDTTSSTDYFLKETNNPKISDFKIGGVSDDIEYVLFDDKNIINNSKRIFKEISEDKTYREKIKDQIIKNGSERKSKFGEEKSGEFIYKNIYVNNNLNTYNAYNVWDSKIGKLILKDNNGEIKDNLDSVSLKSFNPTGNTLESKFLNNSYMEEFTATTTNCKYGITMIESNLYQQNDKFARGLLLLSTLPFRKFEDSFLKSVFGKNITLDGARIVNLPSLYIYYLGGLLMRNNGDLKINFNVPALSGSSCTYSDFETTKDEYLNLGYQRFINKGKNIPVLEQSLLKLPKTVKESLIKKFKTWVNQERFNSSNNGFFELNTGILVPSIGQVPTINTDKSAASRYILNELQNTTDFIILNTKIFDPNRVPRQLVLLRSEIQTYVDVITKKFQSVEIEREEITEPESDADIKKQTLAKLQIYNYYKNINNKWVGGDKRSFNICGGGSKNLIDYFRFIDRGWRNIGDEATFNLKSFLTLGSNLDTSVYLFMSKLLRDSNFLFQILPTYIDYKDAKEVQKMFMPQTQLEVNSDSGPIFCCIYVGGNSEVLDISERSNYYFKNDGYRFPNPNDPNDKGDLPPDMVGPDDSSLVAFRVAFGAQNQTIFKNVSLNQQEHKETGEYFRALSDLVDKRGGTQQTYVGTDLLRLFKTRSYTCKVDALGCMNIQPLMYFDLQNVPFFNGAYLITSVNHSISPNHMTTNFQGVRQSKFITPPANKITAELDLDLNESSEIPKLEFTNLISTSPLYTIGVLNPTELFDFEVNFAGDDGLTNFKNLGVTGFDDTRLRQIIDYLQITITNNTDSTNAEVTTFLSAILSNSDNLVNKEMPWETDNILNNILTDEEGEKIYYDLTSKITDPEILSDPVISRDKDSYLSSIPIFTTGETQNVAYILPGNNDLKEFPINDEINTTKEELTLQINNLSPDKTNEKRVLQKQLNNVLKRERELINTTQYYNIFKGDSYRFRPRGYLYVIGRKQYYDLYDDKTNIINPFVFSETEENAIDTAMNVWKKFKNEKFDKDKSAYDYSKEGTAASYTMTINISQQYNSPGLETAFNTFENVLTTFQSSNGEPLIDFNNPGPI